jgi:pimeloyl-[acyl-carrier protein] methyl ester esterase
MAPAMKQKITCVMVHGWAMNSAVWQPLTVGLPDWLDVICVDLPGHGGMSEVSAVSLDDHVRLLSAVTQKPALWLGWSMGGLAVLKLARDYPERVAGLFMVSTNPCFVRREDWTTAVDEAVFDDFARMLKAGVGATMRRFLALQVMGDRRALATVRELERAMNARGFASEQALQAGLQILKQTDLRQELHLINTPLHWYLGGRDTLVPAALAENLRQLNPAIEVVIESDAGHVPFLSHSENFLRELVGFAGRLRDIDSQI